MTANAQLEKPPTFVVDDAGGAEAEEIAARLGAHIAARFGPRDETPLHVFVWDGETLAGGLNGVTHWRWLYIRQLWVAEAARGRGLGAALIEKAEREAHGRGCVGAWIDTFEPAVATFYQIRGFVRCGEIPDFPPGAARVFLMKRLGA